jgi:hypothetical protein
MLHANLAIGIRRVYQAKETDGAVTYHVSIIISCYSICQATMLTHQDNNRHFFVCVVFLIVGSV